MSTTHGKASRPSGSSGNTNRKAAVKKGPRGGDSRRVERVAVVGGSSRLGMYMIGHLLERGLSVNTVVRPRSIDKLAEFEGDDRVTIFPGELDEEEVVAAAVKDCDAVLTVLLPWGMNHHSLRTAQAVVAHAREGARLVFSSGWHVAMDPRDNNGCSLNCFLCFFGCVATCLRMADLNDQVEACHFVQDSGTRWTLVRGSSLEEGESEGLPVYSDYVGAPLLASDITRRVDYALFMVEAIFNDDLVGKAPAIVSCACPSALNHAPKDGSDDTSRKSASNSSGSSSSSSSSS